MLLITQVTKTPVLFSDTICLNCNSPVYLEQSYLLAILNLNYDDFAFLHDQEYDQLRVRLFRHGKILTPTCCWVLFHLVKENCPYVDFYLPSDSFEYFTTKTIDRKKSKIDNFVLWHIARLRGQMTTWQFPTECPQKILYHFQMFNFIKFLKL